MESNVKSEKKYSTFNEGSKGSFLVTDGAVEDLKQNSTERLRVQYADRFIQRG